MEGVGGLVDTNGARRFGGHAGFGARVRGRGNSGPEHDRKPLK